MFSASLYYGVTVTTCIPYDPESKGGSESSVKIAKADIVPTEANLAENYKSFADLEKACALATEHFNSRVHSITKKRPNDMLAIEREYLHAVPLEAYTIAFGESRSVSWSSTVTFRNARYSVAHDCGAKRVWVRAQGDEVVIVDAEPNGAKSIELARHSLVGPGQTSINDAHYPARPQGPNARVPKAQRPCEAAFLAIGHGAHRWLVEACACGTRFIDKKMAEAVSLSKVSGVGPVDEALGIAALSGRFASGDLVSILQSRTEQVRSLDDDASLQPGTSSWKGFGV